MIKNCRDFSIRKEKTYILAFKSKKNSLKFNKCDYICNTNDRNKTTNKLITLENGKIF